MIIAVLRRRFGFDDFFNAGIVLLVQRILEMGFRSIRTSWMNQYWFAINS